jgi:hypothetical protein
MSIGRNKNREKIPQMAVELIDSIPYNFATIVDLKTLPEWNKVR